MATDTKLAIIAGLSFLVFGFISVIIDIVLNLRPKNEIDCQKDKSDTENPKPTPATIPKRLKHNVKKNDGNYTQHDDINGIRIVTHNNQIINNHKGGSNLD